LSKLTHLVGSHLITGAYVHLGPARRQGVWPFDQIGNLLFKKFQIKLEGLFHGLTDAFFFASWTMDSSDVYTFYELMNDEAYVEEQEDEEDQMMNNFLLST
jgi:hypothetical protein